jgi:alanine racemase
MSHLARADERDCDYTRQQLQTFETATAGLPGERSLANSAGILGWPQTHFDWVRPGIMLYGASPFVDSVAARRRFAPGDDLQHSADRHQSVAARRAGWLWRNLDLSRGHGCGGGGGWLWRRLSAPCAFGDAGAGQRPREAALIGRVSMDMITLDLRQHPEHGSAIPWCCGAKACRWNALLRPPGRFPTLALWHHGAGAG